MDKKKLVTLTDWDLFYAAARAKKQAYRAPKPEPKAEDLISWDVEYQARKARFEARNGK